MGTGRGAAAIGAAEGGGGGGAGGGEKPPIRPIPGSLRQRPPARAPRKGPRRARCGSLMILISRASVMRRISVSISVSLGLAGTLGRRTTWPRLFLSCGFLPCDEGRGPTVRLSGPARQPFPVSQACSASLHLGHLEFPCVPFHLARAVPPLRRRHQAPDGSDPSFAAADSQWSSSVPGHLGRSTSLAGLTILFFFAVPAPSSPVLGFPLRSFSPDCLHAAARWSGSDLQGPPTPRGD